MTPATQQAKTKKTGRADAASPSDKQRVSLLFTAFEPSGDALAAPVIAQLIKRVPGVRIYALGGPKMEKAGAQIIERTCEDGSMALAAGRNVLQARGQIKRACRWLKQYRVLAHIAVDSPAANFPICKVSKKQGARVAHLAAPQLWAWGRWRLGKLRRRSDLVLCLLPFEAPWFNERGVPARFVGHPVMNRALDEDAMREAMHALPQGSPRIAIFPGSRSQEVRANMRLLASTFNELHDRYNGCAGIIVAANRELADIVRNKIKVFPTGLHMMVGEVDTPIAWCDLAMAVSGTISLNIARHRKPMIGVYKTDVFSWLLSKLLLRTRYRLLPNIIAEREIVPEFVPYIGGPASLVKHASFYLQDSKNTATQSAELNRICLRFANKKPAEESARLILQLLRDGAIAIEG